MASRDERAKSSTAVNTAVNTSIIRKRFAFVVREVGMDRLERNVAQHSMNAIECSSLDWKKTRSYAPLSGVSCFSHLISGGHKI